MIRKIKTHLILWLLMFSVFIICTLIYGREFSSKEWLHISLYYGIIVIILFLINLVKKTWIKWTNVAVIFILLSVIFYGGADNWDYSSLYVVLISAPVHVPFLPEKINYPSQYPSIVTFLFYVLYFLLPLIYWYGLYILSKRIVAKTGKNMAKNAE